MRIRVVIRGLRVRFPLGQQHSYVENDDGIFSTIIPFLPLIREGELTVSDDRMCTILVKCLEG